MTFKGLVISALAEIRYARNNPVNESFDFNYNKCDGFEIFSIPKDKTHSIQFFDKDNESNIYHCLNRVRNVVDLRNERLILAIPGGDSYPLFRPKQLPYNRLLQIGPFDFRKERNRRSYRLLGMLAKDFQGNVFLTNSRELNSKNIKSTIKLGFAIIDSYEITELAHKDIFYFNYFGIGMKSNGELIIVNTLDYKSNLEWINIFVSNECCEATIINSPNSEFFLRRRREFYDLKTYGGYIVYSLNKNDIREFKLSELSPEELNNYYRNQYYQNFNLLD
jgi:hypothetical protein